MLYLQRTGNSNERMSLRIFVDPTFFFSVQLPFGATFFFFTLGGLYRQRQRESQVCATLRRPGDGAEGGGCGNREKLSSEVIPSGSDSSPGISGKRRSHSRRAKNGRPVPTHTHSPRLFGGCGRERAGGVESTCDTEKIFVPRYRV